MSFICTQFKSETVLFDPEIGPYLALPLRVRVDIEAMPVNGYSAFPKTSVLLEPHHQIQAWLQKECYYFVPQSQPDRRHPPSIRRAPAVACGKCMLPVPDPYRGGD